MTYANLDDLKARAGDEELSQIANRDGDGDLDVAVIDAALEHADNIIDGYVARKVTLPFSETPPLVNTWAVSIARYYLHNNGAPDYVETDYKDAIRALKDVAHGLIALTSPAGATTPQTQGTHMASHPDPVFTREKLAGYND